MLEHEKTDRSRGSEVTRPKLEGQQLPPARRGRNYSTVDRLFAHDLMLFNY